MGSVGTGLKRVVILGSGWGAFSALSSLKRSLYRVVVVSPRNHFLFTPLLCSTTVGTLEFRSIIEPLRNQGFRRAQDLRLANAEDVDFERKVLRCRSVFSEDKVYDIPYDKLIIGVGALPNTFNVPGVKEHSFFLKEVSDARLIRNALLANFERSLEPGLDQQERDRLSHIVIVGGGPTGIEFGAELHDFLEKDLNRLYRQTRTTVRVTLVESHQILSSFDRRLQQYAEKKLSQRNNFNLVKSAVTEVLPDRVVLKDGSVLDCGLTVWSTGLSPQPFTANLDVEKNRAGQIITDRYLRVKSDPTQSTFAVGDCADVEETLLPCTAQVAERQGRYVADLLNKTAHDENQQAAPFEFKSMGMLAYIGDYKGLSDLPEFKLKGFTSWFLWRSAYLTRLGSWRLRMQVPLDWTKTLIFGRDTSRF